MADEQQSQPQEERPQQTSHATAPQTGNKDVEENKIFAVIAYLGILFIIPLLVKKDSQFAMYHAKQGMVLFIVDVALSIIGIPLSFVTFGVAWGLISIALLVLWIMGIVNAAQGQMKPLPIIGQYAEKIKI